MVSNDNQHTEDTEPRAHPGYAVMSPFGLRLNRSRRDEDESE